MKKVLSFVLVLSMILGSFGMAFAAPATDVVGKDCEDAANVLTELGVFTGYSDGTFRPENILTRAEMATMIVKALGLNDYAVGKSTFTDMQGHWADPYVAYAVSLGFISGFGDNTFRPSQQITADQAIAMLVQALGYKAEYLTGGYPGAFVNQALTLGMLNGIKAGKDGMTRGDVATLIFNTLDCTFVRYDKDGALQEIVVNKDTDAKDNMLRRLGASTFYATNRDADGYFVVTADEKTTINLKEYQGALAKAYKNSDDKIIAIEEVKSVFVTGDYTSKAGVHYFTTNDDVEYKIKDNADALNANVAHFINGKFQGTISRTSVGAVTLSSPAAITAVSPKALTLAVSIDGKYITDIYSIAEWKDGATLQMTEDDIESLEEDFELGTGAFAKDSNDEIDTDEFVLVGVDSLADIKEDHIVTYYLVGTKVVRVEVGTQTVEGKVTWADKKTDADEVKINGKSYDVCKDSGYETIDLGDEGTFYLDYSGDIFESKAVSKQTDYAMVTYKMATEGGVYASDDVAKVRLFTADGKETIYTVEKDTFASLSAIDYVSGTAVVYGLDKDGEIDEITKAAVKSATGKALTAKGYLGGVKVADNVVVFIEEAKDDYKVGTLADVQVNEEFVSTSATRYVVKDDVIELIILDSKDLEDSDDVYGVVVSKGQVYNSDDKEVWEVEMLVDGETATYLSTKDVTAVPTEKALFKLEFDGKAVAKFATLAAVKGEFTTVYAIKDGNLDVTSTDAINFEDVADDVIVYKVNKDDKFEASKFSAISKGDFVTMYQLDKADDDKDGVDVIIFKEK